MDVKEVIIRLIREKLSEADFQDCFVVEVDVLPGKKVNVFLDCDAGLTLKKCQQVSRHIEHHLDEHVWENQAYTLEVSSPGIDRPLKLLRQYKKNIGKTVKVKFVEGGEEKGVLVDADEAGITISQKVTLKEGKKKKRTVVEQKLTFDKIDKTIVQISFNKKK